MIALQIPSYFPHFYSSHFRFMILCFEHRLSETNTSYFQHFSKTRKNIKGTSFDNFQCFVLYSHFSFIIIYILTYRPTSEKTPTPVSIIVLNNFMILFKRNFEQSKIPKHFLFCYFSHSCLFLGFRIRTCLWKMSSLFNIPHILLRPRTQLLRYQEPSKTRKYIIFSFSVRPIMISFFESQK